MEARRVSATVKYDNKDISADLAAYLKGISYTDNLSGEADTLDLTLEDRQGLWQNEWFPEKGATLDVELQTHNWKTVNALTDSLKLGLFEIDEIGCSAGPSEAQIRSVSVPSNNKLRGVERTRSWEKAELKTIANDVATGADMELEFDTEQNPKIDRAEQTEQSDLSFLLALTRDQGLALKIHDNKVVIFDEAKYEEAEPKITIVKPGTVFLPEDGQEYITDILSYSLNNKTRDIYKACHVKYQKSENKETIEATFTDPAKKDKDGKTLEIKEQVETIADAERLAKKRLREKNKEEWTGNLSVVGNLLIVAATTVALKGFGVFDGNYIIVRASHGISNGYTTNFDVRRCLSGY